MNYEFNTSINILKHDFSVVDLIISVNIICYIFL